MHTKKHRISFIHLIIIIDILTIIALSYLLYQRYLRYYSVSYTPADYTQNTDIITGNPDRGWYHIYGYMLSDEGDINTESVLANCDYDKDTTLCLVEINLLKYRDSSISETALTELDDILSAFSQAGKKVILRFLYDWDGKATETEPDSIEMIADHMEQVSPIVNDHASDIYTLQGIFVGNTGEMNNSNYMTDEGIRYLMNQLANVIDPSIYLAVRTPAHRRIFTESYDTISISDAFSQLPAARIGLFNDGMLGSGNDCGTYGDIPRIDSTSYTDKLIRTDEIAYQNELCEYVPNGGEVILENSYNDFENSITDLSAMHVSYLDSDYDAAVLNKWKNSTYNGDALYHGCNGYDYITNHLGYRYVLSSTALDFSTFADETATMTVSVQNVGFASSYFSYQVLAHIVNDETGEQTTLTIDTDNRFWKSGQTTSFTLPVDVRSLGIGSYTSYLSVTDSSNHQIIFANDTPLTDLGYLLGSFTITK